MTEMEIPTKKISDNFYIKLNQTNIHDKRTKTLIHLKDG